MDKVRLIQKGIGDYIHRVIPNPPFEEPNYAECYRAWDERHQDDLEAWYENISKELAG